MLEEIRNSGSTIDIVACDVGDYDAVHSLIESIHRQYGSLKGIVHSAGISGAGYILRKEKPSFLSVFAPKIKGCWYLDEMTREDSLDFMLLCSSAVTDSGEAGQSDYIGANAFLDAFTDYRNAQGRKTYTVNWVSWKETGMSVRHGINVDSVTKALTTDEAIQALDRFLRGAPSRVMIGQYTVDQNFYTLSQYSRNKVSDRFTAKVKAIFERDQISNDSQVLNDGNRNFAQIQNGKVVFIPKSDKALKRKAAVTTVQLTGDVADNYTETENRVAVVYSGILGYDRLNIYDNFFEMGGDSIMLSQMHDRLEEIYPDIIRVADLFEYVTIRSLSEFIDEKIGLSREPNAIEACDETNQREETPYSMSLPQERIYYDYHLSNNKLIYNNPFLSDVTGIAEERCV